MSEVEDWSQVDMLDQDPTVIATLDREAICRAICLVAAATGGIVTAPQVRAELKRNVNPHRIGAVMSGFAKRGILVDTGRVVRSDDKKNRNANRRLPVWRVVDREAIQ